MQQRIKLTPYQKWKIEKKMTEAKAQRMGVPKSKLPMFDEIRETIKNYRSKKQ